ncbi:MAG: hypothetical protein JWR09_2538, partial [Mucilaginibacter sp.]|nr:hypothetical protein [Mucilaginibacter sp.]
SNPFLAKFYKDIPFEALMENCPNKTNALKVLTKVFSTKKSNKIHRLLVDRLIKKEIAALITPNYDMTIDQRLERSACAKIKTKDDIWQMDQQKVDGVYYKIHGSADHPDSIIFTLS